MAMVDLKIQLADGTLCPPMQSNLDELSHQLRRIAALCAESGRTLEYHEENERQFICGPVRRGKKVVGVLIAK